MPRYYGSSPVTGITFPNSSQVGTGPSAQTPGSDFSSHLLPHIMMKMMIGRFGQLELWPPSQTCGTSKVTTAGTRLRYLSRGVSTSRHG
jgi:hypothetical protein